MTGLVDPVELLNTSTAAKLGSDSLAGLLATRTATDPQRMRIRTGVVTANSYPTYTCSVTIAGSTTAIAGIPVMGSMPGVGATVILGQTAGAYVILGALGGATVPRGGSAPLTFSASTTAAPQTVNFLVPFPVGTVPAVTATPSGTDARVILAVSGESNTGFVLRGTFAIALTATITVRWNALYPTG